MPIQFSRYVNITSGVGAGATVARRDLIGRLYTTNAVVPTAGVLEFTDLVDVGNYFGTNTEEYRRALFYLGFVSKTITRPKRIAFARWANVDTAPQIFGVAHQTLSQLQAITSGSFSLSLGGVLLTLSSLNFASASSLADVASAIQVAIRTGTGTVFTQATVTYNAVEERFEFTGGETGASVVVVTAGATNDVAGAIGWLTGAVLSNGVVAETVTDVLANSTQTSNNYGSFAFIAPLTQEQVVQAATWNDAQNVLFQFHVPVLAADASAYSTALRNIGGVGLTLKGPQVNEYPEMLPMAALAATDYSRQNSTINYMYQQANLTPTVTTTADANLYDGLRINYYGNTQTAGQQINFYQRGFLMGTGTDPVDMNTYANEQWLKDAAGADIMQLLLNVKVSANTEGRGQLLTTIRSVIDQALLNGTFSPGKTLSSVQRIFITETSADPLAWRQVQTSGYWINAVIQSETRNGVLEFKAVYTLIYSKDDVIRSVDGSHILI